MTTTLDQLTDWIRAHQHNYAGEADRTTHPIVRAAAVRGIALGADDQDIRTALRRVHIPLPPRRQLAKITASARDHVAHRSGSDSPAARAAERLAVARRLVGRVMAPVPTVMVWMQRGGERVQVEKPIVPARRQVLARRAFAIVGLEAIAVADRGWEGVTVSVQRLAVQLGVTGDTARRTMATLRELGWIRKVKRLSGGAWVYRLPRLDEAGSTAANQHAATVDALADGVSEDDELAAVIAAAREAGWGWLADAPDNGWLVAVLDAAGLRGQAAAVRGGPRRPGATRTWLADVRERGHGDLAAGLAALCGKEGVAGLVAARLAAVHAAQDADRQRRAAITERKAWLSRARRYIQRIAKEAVAAGQLDAADAGRRSWAETVRAGITAAELAGKAPEPRLREAIAEIVAADLEKAGDELAVAGGRWVAGLDAVRVAA